MKAFRLLILLAVATTCTPLAAHAYYFELKLKATCFDLDFGKFTVQKRKLSSQALIAKMLNITPEAAAAFTFTYGAADGFVDIQARCNGDIVRAVAHSGSCNAVKENAVDPVKYARVCKADLGDFVGATVDGSILCASQGKTDTGVGPIKVKGPCVGSFNIGTTEFCRVDGSVGKRFVPKGPCVN